MRLDRFLCELQIGSRSQVKQYIRQGMVSVDGVTVRDADFRIAEERAAVCFRGEPLNYRRFHYYMMNKPRGVVCATRDNVFRTALDLLPAAQRKGIFPVGRLDRDTEGLLLLSDDGELAHRLLSPARHVNKVYLAEIARPLEKEAQSALERGVDIGEAAPTRPARVEMLSDRRILLTLHEGKFHQVKRMLQAVGNEVTALKRVGFGPLSLEESLQPGDFRELTEEEIRKLREEVGGPREKTRKAPQEKSGESQEKSGESQEEICGI